MLLSGVPECFSIVDPRRLRGQDEPEQWRLALYSLQHYYENHMIFFLALASQHQLDATDWTLKDGEILLCRIKSAVIVEKNNGLIKKTFLMFM